MNIKDDKIPNPHRAAEQVEAYSSGEDGLQSLSPELKEAIVLRDLEGMAYQDIADAKRSRRDREEQDQPQPAQLAKLFSGMPWRCKSGRGLWNVKKDR